MTPGVYIVTGPDYTGAVPGEMIQVKSRTKFGVVAVRILAKGAADLPKAAEAQKGFHLMPLSAYLASGLAYKPPNPRPLLALYESKAPQDIRYFDGRRNGQAASCFGGLDRLAGRVVPADRAKHRKGLRMADARRADEAGTRAR